MNGNREYKSDVFCMLMQDPKRALELYNVMNDSSYDDPEIVEIKTLEGGISLSVRNDAAFVVDARLSIYEHQSSVCPNMPVRSLIYFTAILAEFLSDKGGIRKSGKNIYGRRLVKIPTPHFVVFYNGEEAQPEIQELRLSDAFEKKTDDPKLELKCMVYNINEGKNRDILNRCRWLSEYMDFVNKVRECHYGKSDDDLLLDIETAIDYCVEHDILKEFLKTHRNEVVKNMQLDYTFDRQLELERADAREEGWHEGHEEGQRKGREEGLQEGRQEGLQEGLQEGRQEGLQEGRQEERELIINTIKRLRNGESPEQLIAEGVDRDTVEIALEVQ